MKNTIAGVLCCFVLPSLWVGQSAAVAQETNYGNDLTNIYEVPTNYTPYQPVAPTTHGSGFFGAPYMGTSAVAGSPSSSGINVPTGPGLVEWGPLHVYPHLRYSVTYGNGIEAAPGTNSTTWINTVTPGVLLTIGTHWSLDYSPSLAFYSNPAFRDTTDQNAMLRGGTTYGDWTLNLSQAYVDTTQPLVETGTQVEQVAYATAINANLQMNDRASLQLAVSQNFRFAQGLNNLHEWTTADWYNYQLQPQLGTAIGVTGGYDEVSVGSDMPFEEILGRIIFRPGTKLHLIVMGGVEDRQFIQPSASALVTPVFNASAVYQLFPETTVTVAGNRTVTPSFYGNEVNTVTSVTADVHQKIVGNMFLDVSGGYTSEPYTSIEPGPLPPSFSNLTPPTSTLAVVRSDTITTAQVRLSTAFRTHFTGSIFYTLNEYGSSQSNYKYSGNQVGLELDYHY
jgi:hypothetical protein